MFIWQAKLNEQREHAKQVATFNLQMSEKKEKTHCPLYPVSRTWTSSREWRLFYLFTVQPDTKAAKCPFPATLFHAAHSVLSAMRSESVPNNKMWFLLPVPLLPESVIVNVLSCLLSTCFAVGKCSMQATEDSLPLRFRAEHHGLALRGLSLSQ